MNRTQHPSNNGVLAAPRGQSPEQCTPLAITRCTYSDGAQSIRSFWKPTPEELAILNNGGFVMLEVIGLSMAPVRLIAEY